MKTLHYILMCKFAPAACCLLAVVVSCGVAVGQLTFEPSWQMPRYASVRTSALEWIEQSDSSEPSQDQARALWPPTEPEPIDGTALLSRVAETFSLVNTQALALFEACNAEHESPLPPDASWLDDHALPEAMRNNLRLYYARWLAQQGLYDEVLVALEGLAPADVVDPAGLLFYRLVAHQQLVQPDQSRAALVQLLEQEAALPRRYQQVAQLVQRDLAGLKDESLDHIARRMNDVRRRLEFGRAGKQVQMVEKGVVDSLDKIIKKLEEQQQQSSSSSGSAQSSKPMDDSRLPSMKAPMKVDQRDIGNQSGWGELPDKERKQAMQQIGREFPAHYRELINEYFRELAEGADSPPSK
ncbi:MAG: hypothetical protein GXP26_11325 [Planctomycetes bacterium]|nr:hypothetical protein [Planctomycetota bacterium]